MKTYRIVQYIQPWEIDDLERQIYKLIESSYMIEDGNKIIFDVTLNISDKLVDWNESKLPQQFFIDKFKYLETILAYNFTTNFDTDKNIQGLIDKNRTIPDKTQDYIIWLDPDIFFTHLHLAYLVQISQTITDEYFILSPQCVKYWDNSWDCITNPKYLKFPDSIRATFDVMSLESEFNHEPVTIYKNPNMKVTGWGSLFTTALLRKIRIPIEMGSYGPLDTYVAMCAPKLGATQYVMNNVVVADLAERFWKNKDYIKPLLSLKTIYKEGSWKCIEPRFHKAVQDFYNSN